MDANFASNWLKEYVKFDPAMAKSRSGWVITYANCPILWASKMQPQVALSNTEAGYISLSSALQDVISLMNLAKKLWDKFDFDIFCSNIDVFTMLLRITLVLLKFPSFQRCILKQNISTFVITILENILGKVRSSFMLLVQRIRWQTCLPNHFHKIHFRNTINLSLECEVPSHCLAHHVTKSTKILLGLEFIMFLVSPPVSLRGSVRYQTFYGESAFLSF